MRRRQEEQVVQARRTRSGFKQGGWKRRKAGRRGRAHLCLAGLNEGVGLAPQTWPMMQAGKGIMICFNQGSTTALPSDTKLSGSVNGGVFANTGSTTTWHETVGLSSCCFKNSESVLPVVQVEQSQDVDEVFAPAEGLRPEVTEAT